MLRLPVLGGGLAVLIGVLGFAGTAGDRAERPIDFNRDIRPILSDNCFTCHGPDASKRRADLRLDTSQGAFEDREKGQPIAPGKSDESLVIQRVTAEDERDRMPPRKAGKPLSKDQVDLLRRWIDAGASWTEHWSLLPPASPPLPAVRGTSWPRSPIDNFILARLESEGLEPSEEADRPTLIRRASLDVTGLPPTPAEVDAFVADASPDAYEKVVDRLLASPRYGERMAQEWLDLARYADTHGYHIDSQRDMWRWRDWVIDAFNANMPFDQFAIEQLAGDLLPDATLDQRIASGFNRNNMVNFEGGAIPEEYHTQYVIDRVNTTSTVFLGMTMGCAQCHDHKYDPIPRKDFYSFFAFFNNVPENGLDGSQGNAVPYIQAPTREQQAVLDDVRRRIAEAESSLRAMGTALDAAQETWEAGAAASLPAAPGEGLSAHYELDQHAADTSGRYRHGTFRGAPIEYVPGKLGSAAKLPGTSHLDCGDTAAFDRGDAFSYGAWIHPASQDHMAVLSRMDDAALFRGYDLYLGGGKVFVHLIHAWEANAIRVNTKDAVEFPGFRHVFATYDGSGKAAGIRIYVDGRPQSLEVTHDTLTETIRTPSPLRIGSRSPGAPFRGELDDVRIYARALTADEVAAIATGEPLRALLAVPAGSRTDAQTGELRRHFLALGAPPEYRAGEDRLAALRKQLQDVEATVPTTMVMAELEKPRETHMLRRGVYTEREERVEPATPSCLPPMPQEAPRNRLGLARWVVDPAHPRTSRVVANRIWQSFFGTGIVKTVEDFGAQGELPSHPDLLDWLASEFVRSGWNVKALQRLVLTSATYRQSSRTTQLLQERDPENRLLARGPRFRPAAEVVRDTALYVSGLLVEKIGGPSVKPYQPGDLWKDVAYGANFSAQTFVQDHGESLYRRSLYTFWKRSAPPPGLNTFDAPDREVCTARRSRTNTPLQALTLLNDVTFVEAARALAARMMREAGPGAAERVSHGFRLATARAPDAEETGIFLDVLEAERKVYRSDGEAALKLLGVGESPRDESLDAAEHAAWTVVASMILNLDEALTKN